MDVRFQRGPSGEWKANVVLAFAFKGEDIRTQAKALIDVAPWLDIAPALNDFKGEAGEIGLLYGHPKIAIPRIILCGLGGRDSYTVDTLRKSVSAAMQKCRELKLENIGIDVETLSGLPGEAARNVEEAVVAAILPMYTYERFRTTRKEPLFTPSWISLFFAGDIDSELRDAARRGESAAAGIYLTRDLVNGPANLVTPSFLEEQAGKLAARYGFTVRVLNREEIAREGMGAFESVFKGAVEDARLIAIEHCPKGRSGDKPVVFVGKGVTFDTGGISLKPSANMGDMKSDMGGAGAIFGLFEAIGQMGGQAAVDRRIIGVMPCTENMPDGQATRPGDVVKSLSGQTIEIINTDAEGRLILCDAMTWAQREYDPALMVDLATLTGACLIALGNDVAAVFATDEVLSDTIRKEGETVGDLYWPLPLWDRYFEDLKSDVADMKNVGGREGGTINAALFLKQFVDEGRRWAHLDIAGPTFRSKKSPLSPFGATGFAVRTLLQLALNGVEDVK
ncbi:leucyl aminopeptidase [Oleidesulfovibrio sp.]|uniref:leucyl aminopeptidase n=1 Tax=Oleidesulfovibrio sp. TaxID=2909707 RepID=UPI003A8B4AEA